MKKSFLLIALILSVYSCNPLRDYFREPDTDVIAETLNSARLTGYSVTLAMAAVNNYSHSDVVVIRSNQGFPCTAIVQISLHNTYEARAEKVTVAGLWADENTAVLSLLYTNYNYSHNIFELVGFETIPVIVENDFIHIALARQDISLNPDQDALLTVDLDNLEFESELIRLDYPRPGDVYVAVTQNAYFIDVNTKGTPEDTEDDNYNISGGGQMIEIENNSAEIIQQAVIDVTLSSECRLNPFSGMALMKMVGLEDEGFPELGTAIFEFKGDCNGRASVMLATGIYIGVNGKKVSFTL